MPDRPRAIRWLWIVGGMALMVMLSYAGFAVWARVACHNAITRAQGLLDQGKPAEARRSVDRALRFDSNHADALVLLGKCLEAEEAFDAAAEVFGRVSAESPRHEEASLARAFAYLHHLRFDAGEEALVRHLEQYPTGPEHPSSRAAQEELKWVYFNQLRRRELEQLLQTSLARHPREHALLVDLLNIEFRRQLAQEGIGHLESVNEKRPGQPSVVLALGYCHWKLGDVKTAWQWIQAAADSRPDHLETRFVAAEILLEQDQLAPAEALLTPGDGASASLNDRFQKDDRWWWLESKLAEARRDDALALEYVEKALVLRPFELQYVHRRAVLLQVLGKTEKAAEAFAEAKELELCESRLNEIVRSGALENPTVDVCLEVAELCEKRGRKMQAEGWRYGARQLTRQATNR